MSAPAYARDLDLNLLRVFVVVAESGSVTAAASRLYLTQPAVSAALKRLADAVGTPLFARQGRGLVLTARGQHLLTASRPHLEGLIGAALAPATFDPRASDRTIRVGLSDASEGWLLPPLVAALEAEAPRMRVVVLPVQFRTVGAALASGSVDFAVTVADELPKGTSRRTLFVGGFGCLHDPRHARLGPASRPSGGTRPKGTARSIARRPVTLEQYLAHDHVVVSYNGDLRGIVEDLLGVSRSVRVSIPTFHGVGALIEGTALLATVPLMVARRTIALHPALRVAPLPFRLGGTPVELLWRSAVRDDDAVQYVMTHVARIAREAFESASAPET